MSESAEEWISASVARSMGPAGTDFTDAIIERAKVGLVKAKARKLISDRQGQKPVECDCEIPQEFWGQGVETENWDQGDFGVLSNPSADLWMAGSAASGFTDSRAFGVTFARMDIEAMIPSVDHSQSSTTAPTSVAKNPGGRRPYDWEAAMIELAGQLYEGALKPDTQAVIENAIKNYFSEREIEIGDTTAKDHARPLYQRLTRNDEN